MKKVLFVANIHKHFNAFHLPYINYLKSEGYEVHVAANDPETRIAEADKQYDLPINRNPFSKSNVTAVRQLKKIIAEERYSLIHCHTAMGSVVARLAARKFRKEGWLKVLYTVHGFHFYKGSPKMYWQVYYPMEKYLSKYTDGIIVINEEDYALIQKSNFKNKETFKVPGVGINSDKFKNLDLSDKPAIRAKNGYSKDTFLIIYIAEFITRKNHKFILESVAKLQEQISDFKFIFAGRGILKEEMESEAKTLGIDSKIDFLGFRKDIGELIIMSDIGVSVSRQEGLPMNVAEEMYAGKPVVASEIRGHTDLVDNGENGFLYQPGNHEEFTSRIIELYNNKALYNEMSGAATQKAAKFALDNCLEEMKKIYKRFL